jgi:hypothetical protein
MAQGQQGGLGRVPIPTPLWGRTGDIRDGILVGAEADPAIWQPPRGEIVFQCCHLTGAKPWKAPKANRQGKVIFKRQSRSYRTWKSWSSDIKMELFLTYRLHDGRTVDGPVDLDVLFVLAPGPHPPDRTNLLKSFEDLLQGFPYVNDRQVQGGDARLVFVGDRMAGFPEGARWLGPERIHWRVTSLA